MDAVSPTAGVSGFAIYVPPYRVDLRDWCRWTGESPDKVLSVVGDGFRVCGERENVYTMAASAVMRLIRQHDVDPRQVGMLALGTESSTDNSAGAVIVRGMVDEALRQEGLPPLSRHCEVPEFKQACLGGVYALKAACRYQLADAAGRQAIVVSADIAEYARGTSGEPTQGAGAVAVLVERSPRLLAVDLGRAGSASDYRGPDFRKPFSRFREQGGQGRLKDFPVFNGKYSTTCYLDEILLAMEDAQQRARALTSYAEAEGGMVFLDRQRAVFLHRPYQRMAETGWAMLVLFLLSTGTDGDRRELARLASDAGVDVSRVREELTGARDFGSLLRQGELNSELYPEAQTLIRKLRGSAEHRALMSDKLALGGELMRQVGNLYAAALPAWLAAGFEEAARREEDLTGQDVLAIGYGSGDAAEVIPLQVMPAWRDAAGRSGFAEALSGAISLSESAYQCLHDHGEGGSCSGEFAIERIGTADAPFDERGIEYYRYGPPAAARARAASR